MKASAISWNVCRAPFLVINTHISPHEKDPNLVFLETVAEGSKLSVLISSWLCIHVFVLCYTEWYCIMFWVRNHTWTNLGKEIETFTSFTTEALQEQI